MAREIQQKTEAEKRINALMNENRKIIPAYKTLSTYIDPTRGVFNGDRSKIYDMIDHKVLLDSHATMAKNITSSGMQTGMSDPASKWFKLTMDDYTLDNVPGAREWLDDVTARMFRVMAKSNIYKVFQHCYDEIVTFSTGCFLILEDFEDVLRGRSFTAGEYYLGVDVKGRVNAFGRDFEMSVAQLVENFGLESVSPRVKGYWDTNQPDIMIKVRHLIEENKTRVPGLEDFKNMKFRSWYWESGDGSPMFLAKRGYRKFPVIAPRWNAITTDMVYGKGASWHAVGDVKQLQVTVKDMFIAQEKSHTPPTVEDSSVVGHSNKLPGGVTKTSGSVPNSGVRPAYQINPDLNAFVMSIEALYKKIDRHLFADVFLMITNAEGGNKTAFEIAKLDQERTMLLGGLLHTLNEEMHDEAIDLIFDIMVEAGEIPPPPDGLKGEIKVQYLSILAQAQLAMGVQTIQNTVGYVASMAPVYQGITDNIDIDFAVSEMSKLSGNPSRLIFNKEQVDAIRKARIDQQNQAMAAQMAMQGADAAAKLGKTPMNQGSVLDGVAQAVGAVNK